MRTPLTSGPSSRGLHVWGWADATAARSAGATTLGAGSPVALARARSGEDGVGLRGAAPGQHVLEVGISLDELAAILGDELELPRIEPKGNASIVQEKAKYNSIRQTGPE